MYVTHLMEDLLIKGTPNDDVAVFTNVLQKVNGKWMVVMGQRSTGRKPEESLPQF